MFPTQAATCYCGVALAIGVQLLPLPWPNLAVWRFRARADELDAIDASLSRVVVDAVGIGTTRGKQLEAGVAARRLLRAREQAWDDYFDRENPRPLDEAIGNEASLARMTALASVEAVCYQLARAAGEVDNLGLPPPKKDD